MFEEYDGLNKKTAVRQRYLDLSGPVWDGIASLKGRPPARIDAVCSEERACAKSARCLWQRTVLSIIVPAAERKGGNHYAQRKY